MEAIKPLYRELTKQDVQITVIVPQNIVVDPIYSQNRYLTVCPEDFEPSYNLIPIDLLDPRRYNLGFNPIALWRALKASKPDIIHVFNEYHCFPVAETIFIRNHFLAKRIPIVIYAFQNVDYLQLKVKTISDFIKRFIRKIIIHYNVTYLAGVTAANSEALDLVKQYNHLIKRRRIFWGIDTTLFFPKDKIVCRQRLGLPKDKKIVGYFGRMVQEKGLEDLLRTMLKLKDVHLLLIGSGPYEQRVKQLVRDWSIQGKVIYKSIVSPPELNDYFNSLDCFILPSQTTPIWKEQYGRVLVEAMACGIPIVGSSSGAIVEVLTGYQRHKIFQEGDVDSLLRGIQAVLTEEWPAKKSDDLRDFSIENFAREHIEFYQEILQDSPAKISPEQNR